jgi:DNA repair protein SbcD/Mre11
MRILHTSDWHLGRSFHREGLLDAQSAYIDHLVETVRSERVDAVLVSGDVYDRALPPVDAVELANDALERLIATGVRVVISSGNHDSAQRLGFASDLIDAAGVHLRTDPGRLDEPVLLDDDDGTVGVYAIPYLEPDLVRRVLAVAERSHQAVLGAAMSRVRADRARRGLGRALVMAHAFVTGATASQSERDISVGGVAHVGRDTFDGVDYAALGHLHGRHTLSEAVRYSGSPLAYSFSEAGHRKGSWLVELDVSGLGAVTFVEAPVPRALATLRGTIDELLADPRLAHAERCWVQATLTDARRPRDAMERLRARFPHCLAIMFEPEGTRISETASMRDRVVGRTDAEILAHFFDDVRGSRPDEAETALLQAACDGCRIVEDAAS